MLDKPKPLLPLTEALDVSAGSTLSKNRHAGEGGREICCGLPSVGVEESVREMAEG